MTVLGLILWSIVKALGLRGWRRNSGGGDFMGWLQAHLHVHLCLGLDSVFSWGGLTGSCIELALACKGLSQIQGLAISINELCHCLL
jgi:hypothetical protein